MSDVRHFLTDRHSNEDPPWPLVKDNIEKKDDKRREKRVIVKLETKHRYIMKNHSIVSKYLLFKLLKCSFLFSSAFSLPSSSRSKNNHNNNNNIKAAVIVPGFLTGASEMKSLVDALEKEGIPSVSVPFPNWHWLPCLGGRSARPMLERIDYTVKHLACLQEKDLFENDNKKKIEIPDFQYSIFDCWNDFRDKFRWCTRSRWLQ